MYSEIASIYEEVFPLNKGFIEFLLPFINEGESELLDIGCGPGGYVDYFASKCKSAVGIDIDSNVIENARLTKSGVFFNYSLEQLSSLEMKFNLVYSIGNTVSYLPMGALDRFVVDLHNVMVQYGVFVLQVVNWEKYLLTGETDFAVKQISEERSFHRCYEARSNGEVLFHTALKKGEKTIGSWCDVLYPKNIESLVNALVGAGFEVDNIFGTYQREEFIADSSPAIIMQVRKK